MLDSREPVDLLISDLSMPGMNGVTLIREAQRRKPRLPAILITGYMDEAASQAIGEAVTGVVSIVRKPVDNAQLAERVAMMLQASVAP